MYDHGKDDPDEWDFVDPFDEDDADSEDDDEEWDEEWDEDDEDVLDDPDELNFD